MTSGPPVLNVLLLCDYRLTHAATIIDHINAFLTHSRHRIFVLSGIIENGGRLPDDLDLERFDAVVVHYALALAIDAYLSAASRRRLAAFAGPKAVFIQDEYRFVNRTVAALREAGVDLLFTCVPEDEILNVYGETALPSVTRINVLTSYVPQQLTLYPVVPLVERPIDVAYRGRRYPHWHGRLGREKWLIAERFGAEARRHGLTCDIDVRESKRLYGRQWVNFIRRARAVLGVESGASVFDFDGTVSAASETYQALLPDADYDDVRRRYFDSLEDRIRLEQVSARVFEAMALRTLCILYEGSYSGVAVPWRHYVPLKKDHGNMGDVVAVLRDERQCAEIISRAFAEVALNPNYSYAVMIAAFDRALDERFASLGRPPAAMESTPHEFHRAYPFPRIDNPHALSIASRPYRLAALRAVGARVLPRRAKDFVKALVRGA